MKRSNQKIQTQRVETARRNRRNPDYQVVTEKISRIKIYRGFDICRNTSMRGRDVYMIHGYGAVYPSIDTAEKVIDTYLKRTTENDKA